MINMLMQGLAEVYSEEWTLNLSPIPTATVIPQVLILKHTFDDVRTSQNGLPLLAEC